MSEALGGLQVADIAPGEPRPRSLIAPPHVTTGTTFLTPGRPIALRFYNRSPLDFTPDTQVSLTIDQAAFLAKWLSIGVEAQRRV